MIGHLFYLRRDGTNEEKVTKYNTYTMYDSYVDASITNGRGNI